MITYTLENEWTDPSHIIMDGLLAFNATYMERPSEQKLAITRY